MISEQEQQKLKERFNPENSILRQHQLRMLEMLKYIDAVCKKHDIKYWLCSGTLLGAVRHGGFIPWDDDADIEMLRPDYEKFVRVMKEEPNDRFVLQNQDTDSNYFVAFGKLRDLHSWLVEGWGHDKYFKYRGIYVDIFIIEPSSSRCLGRLSGWLQNWLIYGPNRHISNPLIRYAYFKSVYLLLWKLLFPLLRVFSKIGAKERFRMTIGSGFVKPRYKSDIFPLTTLNFEDYSFPVPHNFDNYLKNIYGSYMRLPDLNKLEGHVIEIKIY